MKRLIQVILMLFMLALFVGAGYLWGRQALSYEKHKIKYNEKIEEEDLFEMWLQTYLSSHLDPLNMKAPLETFDIDVQHYKNYSEGSDNDLNYRVVITGQAKNPPKKLFATQALYEDGSFKYDLYMDLRFDSNGVSYLVDKPYEKHSQQMEEIYRPYAVDLLSGFFNKDSMTLAVRETVDSPWIDTPIEVSQFQTQNFGWFRNDRRIYFEGKNIAILHSTPDSVVSVSQSQDLGETWKTRNILTREELGSYPVPFAYIHFIGDHGVIVLSSSIAGSSEIMTMYETIDKGDTWDAGMIPESSRSPYSVSMVDSERIFVTSKNDPILYLTEDLGATYRSIEIPDYELDPKLLLSEGLVWSDFYIQAEAPFLIDGDYYMFMTQGENGDYNANADALYRSIDRGETWEFVRYEHPLEEIDEN